MEAVSSAGTFVAPYLPCPVLQEDAADHRGGLRGIRREGKIRQRRGEGEKKEGSRWAMLHRRGTTVSRSFLPFLDEFFAFCVREAMRETCLEAPEGVAEKKKGKARAQERLSLLAFCFLLDGPRRKNGLCSRLVALALISLLSPSLSTTSLFFFPASPSFLFIFS